LVFISLGILKFENMKKHSLNTINKLVKTLTLMFLFFSFYTNAQTINPPVKSFGNICASPSFNSYTATFDFSGFGGGTTFVLEMSNAAGSFSSLTPISIISSQTATSPGSFTFSVPANTTTAGQNYVLRVRSIAPAITSGSSTPAFDAYYKAYNNSFTINNNLTAINICGNSGTLSVDAGSSSPRNFSGLKYKWYRNSVLIAGQTNFSLTVNTPGAYYAELDYGDCSSSLTTSQTINVNFVTSASSFTMVSSLGTEICPGTPTTLSTEQGHSYQWYRNNVAITGATQYAYITDVPGSYKVVVGPGSPCQSDSNTIVLNAESFNISVDALLPPAKNRILEGDTLTVTATTDAVSPTYEWFQDGVAVTPANNTPTIAITQAGKYKIVVNQTASCSFSKSLEFDVIFGAVALTVPNVISPNNGDDSNDTWVIPNEYANLEHEIIIMDNYGKIVLQKTNYLSDWPAPGSIEVKSVNPVYFYIINKNGSPIKKGSITIIQ